MSSCARPGWGPSTAWSAFMNGCPPCVCWAGTTPSISGVSVEAGDLRRRFQPASKPADDAAPAGPTPPRGPPRRVLGKPAGPELATCTSAPEQHAGRTAAASRGARERRPPAQLQRAVLARRLHGAPLASRPSRASMDD
eukprot:scaffold1809_cov386-Prasinococcus_capsulatus_cf.AAC.27